MNNTNYYWNFESEFYLEDRMSPKYIANMYIEASKGFIFLNQNYNSLPNTIKLNINPRTKKNSIKIVREMYDRVFSQLV